LKKIFGLTLVSVTLLVGCSKLLPHRSNDKSKASDTATSQTTTKQAKEEKTKVLKGKWDDFDITMTFVYTDIFCSNIVALKEIESKRETIQELKAKCEKLTIYYVALCDEIDELKRENAELKNKLSLKEQK